MAKTTEYDRFKSDHLGALEMAEEHLVETEKLSATIIRQQIELDAWRSGRLFRGFERPDGGEVHQVYIVYGSQAKILDGGVTSKRYPTIDDAVDALMLEEVAP